MKVEHFQAKLSQASAEPSVQTYSAGIVQLFRALARSNDGKRSARLFDMEWEKFPPPLVTSVSGYDGWAVQVINVA